LANSQRQEKLQTNARNRKMKIHTYKLFSALATGFSKKLKTISVEYSFTYFLILKRLQKENYIRFFNIYVKDKKYFIDIYLSSHSFKSSWRTLSKVENRVFLKTPKARKKNSAKLNETKVFLESNTSKQNLALTVFSNSNFGINFTKCFGECLFIIR
jgi:ribosomal protein S8